MSASRVHVRKVELHEEVFFLVHAGFGEDFSGRSRDETLSPEFYASATVGFFEADAVGDADVATVGDSVAALDEFPRAVLFLAVFFLLAGMPADRCRIK